MSMFGSFLQWIGLVGAFKSKKIPELKGKAKEAAGQYDRPSRSVRHTQIRGGAWVRAYRVRRKKRNRAAKRSRRINRRRR